MHVGAGVTTGVTLQDRFTLPVKPLSAVTVIVDVAAAAAPAVSEAGVSAVAAIVKSGCGGAGLTVRLTEVLWLTDPDVPFTVSAEVPMASLPQC